MAISVTKNKKFSIMNDIENLLTELIEPIKRATRPNETTATKPQIYSCPVYEADEFPIRDVYRLNTITIRKLTLNLHGLLLAGPQQHITPDEKHLIDALSERLNVLRNKLCTGEMDESKLDDALQYLYYVGNMEPIFANNKSPFVYIKKETHDQASHASFGFEYMMIMWFIVSRLYTINDQIRHDIDDAEPYERYMVTLNFCIDVVRDMIKYANTEHKSRIINRPSPSFMSNTTIMASPSSQDDDDTWQLDEERECLATYFGGLGGIKARLHILYAKKYEAMFYVGAKQVGVSYDYFMGTSTNNDDLSDMVTSENESQLVDLAGAANQISRHYMNAWRKMDESTGTYHYALYKYHYWQLMAAYIKACVDFSRDDHNPGPGQQALKRMEEARVAITFMDDQFDENFHITVRQTREKVTGIIEKFYQRVFSSVTGVQHRITDGIVLIDIADSIDEGDEQGSDYNTKMTDIHRRLCIDESSQVLKKSLDLLYRFKRGGNHFDTEKDVDDVVVVEYDKESYIKMALSHERRNWARYLLSNLTEDRNGTQFIVIKDVGRITAMENEVDAIIIQNDENWYSLLGSTEAGISEINNKLLLS